MLVGLGFNFWEKTLQDKTHILMPTPDNLKAGRLKMVDNDLYNICQRIKEVDKNLVLVYHEKHKEPWVVIELCADGVERFVARYETCDAGILDNLRYMLAVPFDKRLAEIERRTELENKQFDQIDDDKMDRFLFAFRNAAIRSNFMDPMWVRSYKNITRKR